MADDEEVVQEAEEVLRGTESEIELKPVVVVKPIPRRFGETFQVPNIREIILSSMKAQLVDRQYRADVAPCWAKTIANSVKERVRELEVKSYKIVVLSTILEMKGAGVMCRHRCIWDPEIDHYVDDIFTSKNIYCYTIVYGIFSY